MRTLLTYKFALRKSRFTRSSSNNMMYIRHTSHYGYVTFYLTKAHFKLSCYSQQSINLSQNRTFSQKFTSQARYHHPGIANMRNMFRDRSADSKTELAQDQFWRVMRLKRCSCAQPCSASRVAPFLARFIIH